MIFRHGSRCGSLTRTNQIDPNSMCKLALGTLTFRFALDSPNYNCFAKLNTEICSVYTLRIMLTCLNIISHSDVDGHNPVLEMFRIVPTSDAGFCFKGQLGVPLTVHPWYLLRSQGILGD